MEVLLVGFRPVFEFALLFSSTCYGCVFFSRNGLRSLVCPTCQPVVYTTLLPSPGVCVFARRMASHVELFMINFVMLYVSGVILWFCRVDSCGGVMSCVGFCFVVLIMCCAARPRQA